MLGFDSSGFCGRTTRPKPKPDRPRLQHIGVQGRHLGEAALPGDPIVLFGGHVIVEALSTVTVAVRGASTIDCGDQIISVS